MPTLIIKCASAAATSSGVTALLQSPVLTAAIVAAIVGLVGHLVTRANTRLTNQIAEKTAQLQADLSLKNSELTNRISRENAQLAATLSANVKLAEMRQVWINKLREDMAEFQALAVTPGLDFQRDTSFYKVMARIELSMNPADPDYAALEEALYAYINTDDHAVRRSNDVRFVAVCQRILKREWDVLKDEIQRVTEFRDATPSS